MKTTISSIGSAVALGALLAAGPDARAQTPPPTPVGVQWDCVISGGSQRGIAFLTFWENGSFTGYQLLTAVKLTKDQDPRGLFSDVGRTVLDDLDRGSSTNDSNGSTNAPATTATNFFGFTRVEGPWGFDVNGKVIGHFALEVGSGANDTNRTIYPASFTGKVVTGKRLTMVAYTPNGKLTYKAVPSQQLPSLEGQWYSNKKVGSQVLTEFFHVVQTNAYAESFSDLSNYKGIYWTPRSTGSGPGYDFYGVTLVSCQRKIGFAFESFEVGSTNEFGTLSATVGSFSNSKGKPRGATVGVQEPYEKVKFNAYWQAALPPPPPEEEPTPDPVLE